MMSIVGSIIKKTLFVGSIYVVGYMNWSAAWLLTPVLISVVAENWSNNGGDNDIKREITQKSALLNEKEAVLAKLKDVPSWVYFPDIERCEWLNRILTQVWPNANSYARDLVQSVIEPNIAKALAAYKMAGFKFEKIILGTIPPRIGGIKVYDKNVARNEIIMDFDLSYASDCNISFQLMGMRGGIKNFEIHGKMRVVMKPLIPLIPLVGGLQIYFLDNPSIDFNLVGVVDILDMPGLNDIIRKIIIEQVAAIVVLPNMIPITLNDTVIPATIKMAEPEGVLRIHLVEAKDLMKKDIGMLGSGSSDPYGTITVGAQQFRTKTIKSSLNPKWDYWCEAFILAESGQTVHIQLMDEDDTSDDEFLGIVTIDVSSVLKRGIVDSWLRLENAKRGTIHVRLSWYSLSKNAPDLSAALLENQLLSVGTLSTAILSVFIDSAIGLPQARSQSKPDPYAIFTVNGAQTKQTTVQLKSDIPVWEQGFTFFVQNPDHDFLSLRIIDQKTEKELGYYQWQIHQLLEIENLELIAQEFQLKKSSASAKCTVSLALRILKKPELVIDNSDAISTNSDKISSEAILQEYPKDLVRQPSSLSAGSNDSKQPTPPLVSAPQIGTSSADSSNNNNINSDGGVEERISLPSSLQGVQLSSASRNSSDSTSSAHQLFHRVPSTTLSAGAADLGRIQVTLRYSVQRQRLIVIVHKIMNIPLKDPSNIPDPYVKLYLLPGRSKESKRKTNVLKDTCNPVYDATFEYIISSVDLTETEVEVTVCTQKGFLSGGSPVIGMLKIPLNDLEITSQGSTGWYDLYPESKFE